MDNFLQYVNTKGLKTSLRGNVAAEPVQTVTLGGTNRRGQEGIGISAATSEDGGELVRLVHAVAKDASIFGSGP